MKKIFYRISFSILLIIFSLLICINTSYAHEEISIESKAGLLVERSQKKILFEKNIHEKMYPASTTKILTAIVVLENANINDYVTVSQHALDTIPYGYVTCNLQVGEELKVQDLLYALMIESANDAAVVLAEHVAGSVEDFADMMNEKAREIGCENTHFVNPNGIHDENHYCTAYDLYLMTEYALTFNQNEIFRDLVSRTSYTLPATNKHSKEDRTFTTTNELMIENNNDRIDNYYYKYAFGIKTGHTKQAGYCLVSSASRDNLEFISVILGGGFDDRGLSERYTETIKLFNFGYNNFTLTKLKSENNIISTIEVDKATRETKTLNLLIKDPITVINDKETDINKIEPIIDLNKEIKAPIEQGQKLGTITYIVDGTTYKSDLIAEHAVKKNHTIRNILSIALILFIIYFILLVIRRINIIKKKRLRRQKILNNKKNYENNYYRNMQK